MSIKLQKTGSVYEISVNGRLDQEQTPQLESMLNQLLEEGKKTLLVNLTDTSYINSGGLRCLVSAWRKARSQSGDLALCGLNVRLEDIFSMVGFDKVFHIYPDTETAHKALN